MESRLRSCEVILSDMLPTRVVSFEAYSPITLIFNPRHGLLPCLAALPCLTINTLLVFKLLKLAIYIFIMLDKYPESHWQVILGDIQSQYLSILPKTHNSVHI